MTIDEYLKFKITHFPAMNDSKMSSQVSQLLGQLTISKDIDIHNPNQRASLKVQPSAQTILSPLHSDYRQIYVHRLNVLSSRLSQQGTVSISTLKVDQKRVEVIGVIKRVESKRVRAFEDSYGQNYMAENRKPIYSSGDLLDIEDTSGRVGLRFDNTQMVWGTKEYNQLLKRNKKVNSTKKQLSNTLCFETEQSGNESQSGSVPMIATEMTLPHGLVVKLIGTYQSRINSIQAQIVILPAVTPLNCMPSPAQGHYILFLSCPSIASIMSLAVSQFPLSPITFCIMLSAEMMACKESLVQLDPLLCVLRRQGFVFVIPGTGYPKNYRYPLPQINKIILPNASRLGVKLCGNPTSIKMDQLANSQGLNALASMEIDSLSQSLQTILVTCGQPLQTMLLSSQYQSPYAASILPLLSGHLCPPCPSLLNSLPYSMDPLILSDPLPRILVNGCAGNDWWLREEARTKVVSVGVREGKGVMVQINEGGEIMGKQVQIAQSV